MSIVGQTKNVLVTAVGIYLFNDFTPTLATTTGITISILGSSFFAYHKYQQNRQKLEGTPNIEDTLEEKKPFSGRRPCFLDKSLLSPSNNDKQNVFEHQPSRPVFSRSLVLLLCGYDVRIFLPEGTHQ